MEKKEIKHLHEKIKKTNLENENKITNVNNLYLQDTIIIIILRDIIDYLISNKVKYKNKNYSIKRYYLYKNEIIYYSLVSNKWFNIISTIITNNLIENRGIGNWLLKPIISFEDTDSGNSQVKKVFSINYNHIGFINNLTNYYSPICNIEPPNEIKLEIGKKKSIIKINVNDIKKIFNFQDKSLLILNEFIDSFNSNNNNNNNNINPNEFDKIIINISNSVLPDNEEVIKYLSNPNFKYKLNNENVEININKIFIDEENQVFSNLNENIALDNKMNVNKLNIVGCREYDFDDDDDDETSELYENEFNELKKLLLYLNPKHLKYSPNSCYPGSERFYHCDYSCLFNPDYNNSIISISIDYSDFVEPINLIRINELNNLRSISLPFLFHEMFKLNNCSGDGSDDDSSCDDDSSSSNDETHINNSSSSYSCNSLFKTIKHKDSVKQDWIQMINSISNTKSLKSITLKNYCKLFDTAKNNNLNEVDLISNGIQTIIKSLPYLKSLKLVDIDPHIYPSIVFSTLLSNSTSTSTSTTKTKNDIENYSINTLIIKSSFIPISELLINYLFRDLLSLPIKNQNYFNHINNSNNKIRNLKLIKKPVDHKTSQLIIDNIKYLENNNLILNLYSLEFVIDISKINQILDLLNSKSLLLIKELNLIYMDNQDEKIENIILSLKSNSNNIINNKVINFIKL